jgi:non-homologous end joining protein Ku
MPATLPVQKLMRMAGKFVADQNGEWDHDAWEDLLAKAAKLGVAEDDESRRNLGNILEAGKFFHQQLPDAPKKKSASKKKKSAARKTGAKAKSRAKKKQ